MKALSELTGDTGAGSADAEELPELLSVDEPEWRTSIRGVPRMCALRG